MIKSSGLVDVESWWNYLEEKILEGLVFKDIKLEQVKATSIAPWMPPACRGRVVNTEFMKCTKSKQSSNKLIGCPKALASLIYNGNYNPLDLPSNSETKRNL